VFFCLCLCMNVTQGNYGVWGSTFEPGAPSVQLCCDVCWADSRLPHFSPTAARQRVCCTEGVLCSYTCHCTCFCLFSGSCITTLSCGFLQTDQGPETLIETSAPHTNNIQLNRSMCWRNLTRLIFRTLKLARFYSGSEIICCYLRTQLTR